MILASELKSAANFFVDSQSVLSEKNLKHVLWYFNQITCLSFDSKFDLNLEQFQFSALERRTKKPIGSYLSIILKAVRKVLAERNEKRVTDFLINCSMRHTHSVRTSER